MAQGIRLARHIGCITCMVSGPGNVLGVYMYDEPVIIHWPRHDLDADVIYTGAIDEAQMRVYCVSETVAGKVELTLVGARLLAQKDQYFVCSRHLPAPWFGRAFERLRQAEKILTARSSSVTTKPSD